MVLANPSMVHIHDLNWHLYDDDPTVGGERKARGLVPRDLEKHPPLSYAGSGAIDIPLIPQSEWPTRIKELEASKSRLSDMRAKGMFGQMIPARDQNGKGYCTPAGTRIRLANGTVKNIEDVRLLDEVLSAEGNVCRVMECYTRHHEGEMVTLKLWGHGHLRLTPNHEVLTRRGYVPSGELTSDDWVVIPRYAPERCNIIVTADHTVGLRRRRARVLGEDGKSAECWETRQPMPGEKGYVSIPEVIHLTPGVGRILGLWLAEGHIDQSTRSVVWSFNTNESETLVADLVRLLEEEWGVTAKTRYGPATDTVTQVVLSGVLWCQLFESLCGKGARNKKPHADLMSGPRGFLRGLLCGWLEGDGSVSRGNYQQGATISHDLALAMFDIANALGFRPALNREKPQTGGGVKARQPVWKVKYPVFPSEVLPCGYDYRVRVEEGCTWRRVRAVEREPYSGMVYNFAVEGDNSYVAEGVGVHNCWAHSGVSAHLLVRARDNQPYVDLSAYAIACIIKSYRDEGGWGAQGVDWQRENGCPSSEFWPQQSMNRSNDNPGMRANAKKHLIAEGWWDLSQAQYNRNLTWQQEITCYLSRIPVVKDENWWSHSICGMDAVDGASQIRVTRDAFSGKLLDLRTFDRIWGMDDPVLAGTGVLILNSWGQGWSDNGAGILSGSKAISDGAVAIRSVYAATD